MIVIRLESFVCNGRVFVGCFLKTFLPVYAGEIIVENIHKRSNKSHI